MKKAAKKKTESGEQVSVRFPAEELKALDRVVRAWGYETRSQALRGLVRSASAIHARSGGRVET